MPVVTGSSPPARVVVVSTNRNVGSVTARSSAVRVPDQGTTLGAIAERTTVVQVAAAGPQGAQGLPGLSGVGLLAPINFAFGDATPTPVVTLGETSEVTQISLQIEEAFDGIGAAIRLGTLADPDLLVPAVYNDPSMAGAIFEYSPRAELSAGTQLFLTLTPGAGASQGRGQFVITVVPST